MKSTQQNRKRRLTEMAATGKKSTKKKAPAKTKSKSKPKHGGARLGSGRPAIPLEVKLAMGKQVTAKDYEREGLPVPPELAMFKSWNSRHGRRYSLKNPALTTADKVEAADDPELDDVVFAVDGYLCTADGQRIATYDEGLPPLPGETLREYDKRWFQWLLDSHEQTMKEINAKGR
jgi:hypothetical protein